ncbi:MAG: ATP-binding protein [Clostridia bacterium]|nr:ATP-binding protein [Clostridia bacterium]
MPFITQPLGLKNLREAALEQSLKTGKEFPYSGIWLFSGQQGAGKTLLMMHTLKCMINEYPEALVVSNIAIYGVPSIPYTGIEDFERYKNGAQGTIFVIDEIHTLFSSLESAKMPPSTLTVWSQNRKNRRVILGTSQRFTRVAKGIREQCTYNYECSRPILGQIYSYRVKDGDEYDDAGKYIGEQEPQRHFYVPSVNVMRMYNTLEVVVREKAGGDERGTDH